MTARHIATLAAGVLLASCRAAAPWLDIQPVEVQSISPGEGLIATADLDAFRITYSATMNRALTEAATELRENGDSVALVYAWAEADQQLVVRPVQGFSDGSDYELELGTGTEDTSGNSLPEVQIHRVATRTIEADLQLTTTVPLDDASDVALTTGIVLDFTNPLDRVAVLDAISIDPNEDLLYEYANGDRQLTLTPVTQWTADTRYTLRLTTALLDAQGNALAQDRELRFRTIAQPAPELTQLVKTDTTPLYTMRDTTVVFSNNNPERFEADATFTATFTPPRAVLPSERLDAITVRPAANLDISWAPDGLSANIAFAERLDWQTEYVLTVLENDFRFLVDGPGSTPPTLSQVVYIDDVNAAPVFHTLTYGQSLSGTLPTASPAIGAFDLYIEHAPGATIPLDAALQALSTSVTNAGLSIDVQAVAIISAADAATATPPPQPLPGTNQTVLRYIGDYYDNVSAAGTLTLTLGTDLRDDFGNTLANAIAFLING